MKKSTTQTISPSIPRGRTAALALAAVLPALLVLGAPSAGAAEFDEARFLIAALRADTEAVAIDGRKAEVDRAGLLAKLDEAVHKLDQDKPVDAIQKVSDYKQKVFSLGEAGKMDPTDVLRLLEAADAVIASIQAAAGLY